MTSDEKPGRAPQGPGGERPAVRRRRRLGELLVEQGTITTEQLEEALTRQKTARGSRLGALIVELGFTTEVEICEVLAEQLQIPAADLVAVDIPNEVLNQLPRELATTFTCLPWFVEGRELYLIMADPTNVAAADAVAFHTGLKVRPVVAPESEIIEAIARFYAAEESSLAQFENLDIADQLSVVADMEGDTGGDEDVEQAALAAPVVKLVNAILADAIRSGASDIHVEPQDKKVNLRYRVDGLLHQVMAMPKRIQSKVISRIKIMSHMDISERRKPQDGRTFIRISGRNYDLRVSTLPTADGETCVMRILVQDRAQVALDDLGLEEDVLAAFKGVLDRPQGMILVTGPTGSGKTSTLYAALNYLKDETTNIVTVEDPVEYRLGGVNQVAVSDKSGMTFAAGLRSILRQDPDVIMVGEIRDLETAQIAFQAAQTGHLVLSTLHTNDAPSAVTRLVEMGMPAYVVASSLLAVQAQRLVRRLCACKQPAASGESSPKGCEACRYSGYKGRIAVYELMRLSPRLRSVILARGSDDVVRRAAQAGGMASMFKDGLRTVQLGLTTLDELKRIVPPDEIEDASSAEEVLAPIRSSRALSTEGQAARPERILVVDDDQQLLGVLRETLEAERYEVFSASNGEEALELVYKKTPDLILADVVMPRMDGLELLRRVRRNLSTCQIPVIFLTAVQSLDAETLALDLGADDYVAKPVPSALLLGRIRRSLFRAHLLKATP